MPRGRKVNSSGEKSKQLLLEKAIEQFSTYGYHETKISEIVKSANVTQPTYYLYFESKESLYKDLNELFRNGFFEIVESDFSNQQSGNVADSILTHLTNLFEFFLKNEDLTKIGFYDSESSESVKKEFASNLMKILEKEKNSFLYQDIDVLILAHSILGAVERLTLTALFTKMRTPEQLASDIVNIHFANRKQLVG
ncbi:TetR/AcrR family transcriptional regulator [Ureibacillus sp. NPDC094379]